MKSAKEIYKDEWEESEENFYFSCIYDYQPILEEIGKILIQVDDDSYQGDSRVLFEKNGKYGYLIFGWGSCSGCDALQACRDFDEVQELVDQLENDVRWFDTIEDLQKYFREKDWEVEYGWYYEKTREFVDKVLQYKLGGEV